MTAEDQPQVVPSLPEKPVEENLPSPAKHSSCPMLLALAALVVSGGVATLMIHDRATLNKTAEDLSAQSAQIDKIQSTQQLTASSLKEQAERLSTVGDNLEHLKTLVHQDQESWVLSEVDYLVRLANYNLQYVGDGVVAKKLLEAADQRIETLGNPKLSEIRATITNNIMQLGGDNAVDVEKILERLNQLSANIPNLHILAQATLPESKATPVAAASSEPQNWQDKLKRSLDALHTVVTIRHLAEPPKPLITPDQQLNLIENIQLQLSIAQWAVLHHKQQVYSSALAQAKTWISTYFRKEDLSSAVITGLTELEHTRMNPNLPDLSPTVVAVHEVIQQMAHNPQPVTRSLVAPATAPAPVATPTPSPAPTPAPSKPKTETPAKEEEPTHPEVLSS